LQFVSELYINFLFQVLPQITPFSFGDDQDVNFDEAVAATCIITKGDLPISVWWTLVDDFDKFEKNLTTNDGVVITRTSQKFSMLTIDAVKARHRGNYTCFAKNKAGISQHSAFLAINGDLKNL
jgi:Immunoglobulin domain